MQPSRRELSALVFAAAALPVGARAHPRAAVVIARGGAVGAAPAQSRAAYEQAIKDGADFLSAELAVSRDGVLVVLGDTELSASTDISGRAEFAARRTVKSIDGAARTGWFVEDFDLAELKTLICGPPTARRGKGEPPPAILTLRDIVEIARTGCVRTARVIGVYVDLVRSAYFAGLDLALEPRLAETIVRGGYNTAASAMIVQSPEPQALKTLAGLTRARRVLRIAPGDLGDLTGVRAFAHGVAPNVSRIIDDTAPRRPTATRFVADAHAAGLVVHARAVPSDPPFLVEAAYRAGADGVITDLARPAARARGRTTTSENRET